MKIEATNLKRAAIVDDAFGSVPVRSHNRDEIESQAYEYLLRRIAKRGLSWDSIDLETLESIALSAMRDARRLLAVQYRREQERHEQLLPEQDWNHDWSVYDLTAAEYAIVNETLNAAMHDGAESNAERLGIAIRNYGRDQWSDDWQDACIAIAEFLTDGGQLQDYVGTPEQLSDIAAAAFAAAGLDC
jgi:hypothetical protein